VTDPELMAKYDLSARGLQSAFIKLVNARAITKAELDWRPAAYDNKVVQPNPYSKDEKVFEAYAQQKTPASYRTFWCYRPEQGQITIITITSHP